MILMEILVHGLFEESSIIRIRAVIGLYCGKGICPLESSSTSYAKFPNV